MFKRGDRLVHKHEIFKGTFYKYDSKGHPMILTIGPLPGTLSSLNGIKLWIAQPQNWRKIGDPITEKSLTLKSAIESAIRELS